MQQLPIFATCSLKETTMQVTIIGGGIIGLSCAYYLQKEGYTVTVIERGDITNSCSFGNMGYISPSHFVPLASPGIIKEGLRHMLSSSSPFYVKPRFSLDLLQWGIQFWKSSNAGTVKKNAPHLNNILQLSRQLMNDLKADLPGGFELEEIGCFMLYKGAAVEEHEMHLADDAEKFGVQALEPEVEVQVRGGVLYKDDCHFNPGKLMVVLKNYLAGKGVRFELNTTVTGFEKSGKKITAVITNKGKFDCGEIVLAAGSWLPVVSKMMGVKLLLQPGKGYSYTYPHVEKNIHYPAILVDGRCAITPWGHQLRIGGTMEISGINDKILIKRMQGIYKSALDFYPGLDIDLPPADKIWHGLRPVTPDGLPYIGKHSAYQNLTIAGGHAMLGISQATGTGKIVTELLQDKKTTVDVTAFKPERFN
jgi:D-amino-acid dehydrogenase